MEMYKQASREGWRFDTPKGPLPVEQLWNLTPEELDSIAVELDKQHKASGEKSFLVKKSVKDKKIKTMLDLVLDILNTKVEERDAAAVAAENKEHNQKILAKIANLEEKELDSMSKEELLAQLK